MGPMSGADCTRWHGAMAMDALGALPSDERPGLLAHLDGCPACREEARDLRSTASFLNLVEPSIDQAAAVSPALTGRVLGQLHHGAVRARRRRRVGAALGGLAVAASVAVIVALASSPGPASPSLEHEALVSHGTATASATLAARTWGTEVTLQVPGQLASGSYTVSMSTSSGTWWATGSIHLVKGEPLDTQMPCPVPLGQITGIRVTNAAGTPVLWSESAPSSHWR